MAGKSKYTDMLGDDICKMMTTTSLGLRHICKKLNVPHSTVRGWIADLAHPFSDKYTRAKDVQLELLAEEILDIADEGSNDLMTIGFGDKAYETENKEVTSRSKLRVESRKWLLSKLKPKIYGDKIDVNNNLSGSVSIDNDRLDQLAKIINDAAKTS